MSRPKGEPPKNGLLSGGQTPLIPKRFKFQEFTEFLPRKALSLTASVKPFKKKSYDCFTVFLHHLIVVSNSVIVVMSAQFGFHRLREKVLERLGRISLLPFLEFALVVLEIGAEPALQIIERLLGDAHVLSRLPAQLRHAWIPLRYGQILRSLATCKAVEYYTNGPGFGNKFLAGIKASSRPRDRASAGLWL